MEPKATNTFGIKYLSQGRPGRGRYAVKIEVACEGGRHGKHEYFYEGNDFELAKDIALKVQEFMRYGGKIGQTKALEWKDYDMDEWLERREHGSKDT